MPVFCDAFIGDTTHLSMEELGAYFMIVMVTWRNNGVPLADDDDRFARICRVTRSRWIKVLRPVIITFFEVSEGNWRQKKLEKIWNFVSEKSLTSRENGTKGGRPKLLENKETENLPGYLQVSQTEPRTKASKSISNSKKERETKVSPKNAHSGLNGMATEFQEWWSNYPRRLARKDAEQAYKKARDSTTADELLAGARRYSESCSCMIGDQRRFIKHPATWLNKGCWGDELLIAETYKPAVPGM